MEKEARLCYHAVPRILSAEDEVSSDMTVASVSPYPAAAGGNGGEEEFLKVRTINCVLCIQRKYVFPILKLKRIFIFQEYLSAHRININIRQVN